jgi:aryl-alcohol dehydrogenase-like predicted oxidoreductase
MKLALGTAQFGFNYGISNNHGQTTLSEIKTILATAQENNIEIIDTACLYGESEKALGVCLPLNHSFKIITKTPYFDKADSTNTVCKQLVDSYMLSLKNLNQTNLYALLIHNTNDMFTQHGERLFKEMVKLKERHLVQKIGFSVYRPEQIKQLINTLNFDIIQLPINVLNQRLAQEGLLAQLKNVNIEIHVRSIFLQGLLLMKPHEISSFFSPIKPLLNKYHTLLDDKKVSPIQAAFNFIKHISEIDHIVIGINNQKQLLENIQAYNACSDYIDFQEFACCDEKFINPSNWKF